MSVETEMNQISAVFKSPVTFRSALHEIQQLGIGEDKLDFIISEQTNNYYKNLSNRKFIPTEDTKAPEGFMSGSIAGALAGLLIGGFPFFGHILFEPGVAVSLAQLTGLFAGGFTGGALGGLVGGLIGRQFPEHEIRFFQHAIDERGNILLVVNVLQQQSAAVKSLIEENGGKQVHIL